MANTDEMFTPVQINNRSRLAKGAIAYSGKDVNVFCALVLQVSNKGEITAAAGQFVQGADVRGKISQARNDNDTYSWSLKLNPLHTLKEANAAKPNAKPKPLKPKQKTLGVAFYVTNGGQDGFWIQDDIEVT